MELLQHAASWIECKVSCQALRNMLEKDPDLPSTITTDKNFIRNLRLYIKLPGMTGERLPKSLASEDG